MRKEDMDKEIEEYREKRIGSLIKSVENILESNRIIRSLLKELDREINDNEDRIDDLENRIEELESKMENVGTTIHEINIMTKELIRRTDKNPEP